jgi:hypothetical protein
MSTAPTTPQSGRAPAVVVEASLDDVPLDVLDESLDPEPDPLDDESVLVDSVPAVVESFFRLDPDFARLSVL